MITQQALIESFPGYYVLKDKDSTILAANQRLGSLVGYKNINDYIGLTDHDIKSSAVECANEFIRQDKQVMATGKPIQHIDLSPEKHNANTMVMLKTKAPYYNDSNEIIGTAASAVAIQSNIEECFVRLLFSDKKKLNKHQSYQLKNSYPDFHLSPRESQVLFYLIRGQTAKRTAVSLNISYRTVETHIESLKVKMHCCSKNSVIEKAISLNYNGILLSQILMTDCSID